MSWYDANWKFRRVIEIDATGKGSSPIDATITIPADWLHFWSNIQSTGYDVRVTDADGITLESYDLDAFNTTTKVGTIEIHNMAIDVSKHNAVFVYYGYSGASSGITPFVPSSAASGYISQEIPDPSRVIVVQPERAGAVYPSTKVAKNTSEYLFVYWDLEDALMRRDFAANEYPLYEEIQSYTFSVTLAGAGQAGMIDDALCRVVECNGRRYIRTLVKSGTDNIDYTLLLTVYTTLGRRLQGCALLQVRYPDEAG